MHDHEQNDSGPGTIWKPAERRLVIGAHRITINNLFSPNQYHLYLKCGYAKAFAQRDESLPMWARLYDKMQNQRMGSSRRSEFDALLRSFSERGFDNRYPIPVDQAFQILDGSHRVAGAYAYGVDPVVETNDNPSHRYDRLWFKSANFTAEELEPIDAIQVEVEKPLPSQAQLSVGVIWGCAFEFWDEIFAKLNNGHLITAFWTELADPLEMMAFVMRSYQGDGMPLERMIDKSVRLTRMSTKVGIFALSGMTTEEIRSLKTAIRDKTAPRIPDYFFDSVIHILDCRATSQMLFSRYGGGAHRHVDNTGSA